MNFNRGPDVGDDEDDGFQISMGGAPPHPQHPHASFGGPAPPPGAPPPPFWTGDREYRDRDEDREHRRRDDGRHDARRDGRGGAGFVAPRAGREVQNARPQERERRLGRFVRTDETTGRVSAVDAPMTNPLQGVNEDDAKFPQDAGPDDWIKIPGHTKVDPPEWNSFMALGFGDIYDIDLDRVLPQQRQWDFPGAVRGDFFNFGLNKAGWQAYCETIQQFRRTYGIETSILPLDTASFQLGNPPPSLTGGGPNPGWMPQPMWMVGPGGDRIEGRQARPARFMDNADLVVTLTTGTEPEENTEEWVPWESTLLAPVAAAPIAPPPPPPPPPPHPHHPHHPHGARRGTSHR